MNRRKIERAIHNAHEGNMGSRHGAILLEGNKIIGEGFNSRLRTCFSGTALPAVHAEMQCIKDGGLKRQCLIRG